MPILFGIIISILIVFIGHSIYNMGVVNTKTQVFRKMNEMFEELEYEDIDVVCDNFDKSTDESKIEIYKDLQNRKGKVDALGELGDFLK